MGLVKNILFKISSEKLISFFKKQTIFPYYHIVRDDKAPHIEHLYPYKNISQFRLDIDFLLEHYNPLDPSEVFYDSFPDNSFLLSFDDGLEEIYSIIYPILKEKGIKAIFFINPDFVDNKTSLYKHTISVTITCLNNRDLFTDELKELSKILSVPLSSKADVVNALKSIAYVERELVHKVVDFLDISIRDFLDRQKPYVSRAQIQEMIDDGFYFGGHTMSHPPLGQLDITTQKQEIIDSIEWLKTNFDIDYSLFAFPFSDKSASKKLLNKLFEYDPKLIVFGNAGLKKDIRASIIQRFSLEHPDRPAKKQVITENLYKYFNKTIGAYRIRRV